MSEQLTTSPIELTNGEYNAQVSLGGAWLEQWSGPNGPLLFPKTTVEAPDGSQKVRGGCHVCLPNFGPGGENSELRQHGFGRELTWEMTDRSDNEVTLSLNITDGEYDGLSADLTYELEAQTLGLRLSVRNNGQSELVLAPGFHPYFATGDRQINVNGESYTAEQLAAIQYRNASAATFATDAAQFEMTAHNLPEWVLWSDGLGDYVCVEPTQSGPSFAGGTVSERGIRLQPDATWNCDLRINANI